MTHLHSTQKLTREEQHKQHAANEKYWNFAWNHEKGQILRSSTKVLMSQPKDKCSTVAVRKKSTSCHDNYRPLILLLQIYRQITWSCTHFGGDPVSLKVSPNADVNVKAGGGFIRQNEPVSFNGKPGCPFAHLFIYTHELAAFSSIPILYLKSLTF